MRISLPIVLLSLFGHGAAAQSAFDPANLPSHEGRVAQYSLTPRGDVDGLILQDGTEVLTPPHLGSLLVELVRPGDPVVVHGLRARAVPMMRAASLTNPATGRSLGADAPSAAADGARERPRAMSATGIVRAPLHGPRGERNGILLEDGTIVRLPPTQMERQASLIEPGATVSVRGTGVAGPLGRVIAADTVVDRRP